MSWDLALAPSGDLIFSPSGDLSGISGVDLLQQRMMMRMKIQRGSWTYDDDGSLGSQMVRLTGMTTTAGPSHVDAYVREALREMTEIEVDSVGVEVKGTAVVVLINYHVLEETISTDDERQQQLEVVISSTTEG